MKHLDNKVNNNNNTSMGIVNFLNDINKIYFNSINNYCLIKKINNIEFTEIERNILIHNFKNMKKWGVKLPLYNGPIKKNFSILLMEIA